jgi:hypothetical protein
VKQRVARTYNEIKLRPIPRSSGLWSKYDRAPNQFEKIRFDIVRTREIRFFFFFPVHRVTIINRDYSAGTAVRRPNAFRWNVNTNRNKPSTAELRSALRKYKSCGRPSEPSRPTLVQGPRSRAYFRRVCRTEKRQELSIGLTTTKKKISDFFVWDERLLHFFFFFFYF